LNSASVARRTSEPALFHQVIDRIRFAREHIHERPDAGFTRQIARHHHRFRARLPDLLGRPLGASALEL